MTDHACDRHPRPAATAITLPRMVIEFLDEQHLEELGDTGQVARTWRWVPHGSEHGRIRSCLHLML